jgi:AmiR/NasT family two-component response regulator
MVSDPLSEHSYKVTQASGMVSVQAGCGFDEAIMLMTERAQISGQSIHDIAQAVLDRKIRFGADAC